MSYLASEEIPCSHCKFPNSVEIWSIVNVKDDPELRDLLLGGELNMADCTACKKVFYAESFLLYHDPDAELMAFVYPFDDRSDRQKWADKTKTDFLQSQENAVLGKRLSYKPLTLFGLDELVQILEKEEEASVQGEIVAALAAPLNLNIKKIRPSIARNQELPVVLPFAGEAQHPDRVATLKALEAVEKENNLLSVYTTLRKRFAENPKLELRLD